MLVVRGDAQGLPSELNKAATGEVWFDPILPKTDGVDVGNRRVLTEGRTVWHHRDHGQLLQVTSGYGFVCREGEAPERVRAGDTVWIAPNERHWHGATSSTLMSHTTITIGATEFLEAVTEAEYAAANASRRSSRVPKLTSNGERPLFRNGFGAAQAHDVAGHPFLETAEAQKRNGTRYLRERETRSGSGPARGTRGGPTSVLSTHRVGNPHETTVTHP